MASCQSIRQITEKWGKSAAQLACPETFWEIPCHYMSIPVSFSVASSNKLRVIPNTQAFALVITIFTTAYRCDTGLFRVRHYDGKGCSRGIPSSESRIAVLLLHLGYFTDQTSFDARNVFYSFWLQISSKSSILASLTTSG